MEFMTSLELVPDGPIPEVVRRPVEMRDVLQKGFEQRGFPTLNFVLKLIDQLK
jgi:hypothetical protein